VVESLPSKYKALGSISSNTKISKQANIFLACIDILGLFLFPTFDSDVGTRHYLFIIYVVELGFVLRTLHLQSRRSTT
jgi:hypothetical protein